MSDQQTVPKIMLEHMREYAPEPTNRIQGILSAVSAVINYCEYELELPEECLNIDKLNEEAGNVWKLYVQLTKTTLLTPEQLAQFPGMKVVDEEDDPTCLYKFVTPDQFWVFFAVAFDGVGLFYGYVVGGPDDTCIDYLTLAALEERHVQRDTLFSPTRLSDVKKQYPGGF